jgi:hypothetical protein
MLNIGILPMMLVGVLLPYHVTSVPAYFDALWRRLPRTRRNLPLVIQSTKILKTLGKI